MFESTHTHAHKSKNEWSSYVRSHTHSYSLHLFYKSPSKRIRIPAGIMEMRLFRVTVFLISKPTFSSRCGYRQTDERSEFETAREKYRVSERERSLKILMESFSAMYIIYMCVYTCTKHIWQRYFLHYIFLLFMCTCVLMCIHKNVCWLCLNLWI